MVKTTIPVIKDEPITAVYAGPSGHPRELHLDPPPDSAGYWQSPLTNRHGGESWTIS